MQHHQMPFKTSLSCNMHLDYTFVLASSSISLHQLLNWHLHQNGKFIEKAFDMEGLCFINKLQMHVVWCLDIPDHSQSQLTLNILKQMECQNRKVSSNDKQKTNGNDHQLTFAGQNAFLPNAITNFAIHSKHWKIRRLPFSHQMSSTSLKTFTVPSTEINASWIFLLQIFK